tara:strand:+ start:1349 stop:2536 length:1188 start_codon:yes stop_codon:yes gene_type:complete
MKISIFGSYNKASLGDTAILLGLISSLYRLFAGKLIINVLVLKKININLELKEIGLNLSVNEVVIDKLKKESNPLKILLLKIKRRFFDKNILDRKQIRDSLLDSDYLLIGGGNLIMDLYPQWISILNTVCGEALALNKKYFFIGVGAAPIATIKGKKSLFYCLSNANAVYFRDSMSKLYCEKEIDFYNSNIIPDLALGLMIKAETEILKDKIFIFNIASVFGNDWPYKDNDKFNNYISGMVNLTILIKKIKKIDELVIFNSNYPTDTQGSELFFKMIKKEIKDIPIRYMESSSSVYELIKLSQSAEYAITTRLHAGIIAFYGGANLIAISYQPKVNDVLKEYNITHKILHIEEVLDRSLTRQNNRVKSLFEDDNVLFDKELVHKKIDKVLLDILI